MKHYRINFSKGTITSCDDADLIDMLYMRNYIDSTDCIVERYSDNSSLIKDSNNNIVCILTKLNLKKTS